MMMLKVKKGLTLFLILKLIFSASSNETSFQSSSFNSSSNAINETDGVVNARADYNLLYSGVPFHAVAYLNSNKFAAISGESIYIFERSNKMNYSPSHVLLGHDKEVLSLTRINQDWLASGSADFKIAIWQPQQGQLKYMINEAHSGAVVSLVQVAPRLLASGSTDMAIKLWNVGQNGAFLIRTFLGHTGSVNALCLVDGDTFASASTDQSIRVWNTNSGALVSMFTGHTSSINALVAVNSFLLASGSCDKTIKVWNATSGELKQTLLGKIYPNLIKTLHVTYFLSKDLRPCLSY
jgi:WD40 repeat protein